MSVFQNLIMEKTIKLNNENISYFLRTSRGSRRIRLTIKRGGTVFISAPRFVPQYLIDKFLISKANWILTKIKHFSKFKFIPQKTKKEKRDEYLKYKNKASIIAMERLEYFNWFYNFKWNRVSIKNQKTRWGSCSRKGNLNFNYKISLLPQKSADYIIVHELCHLKEMNHSQKFWNLIEKTIPDYLLIRRDLRKNGYTLD